MNAVRKPYEVLIRYNESGALQGAHVRWVNIITLDDGIVLRSISDAEGIAVAGNNGFPVEEILNETLRDALECVDALTKERDDALLARDAASSISEVT